MNYPACDVLHEIEWIAAMRLEYIELTLGHTAFYLPLASAIEEIRRAAVLQLRRCLEVFSRIGVRWMNIHPDRYTPMHIRSLEELLPDARRLGTGLMI